MKQTISQGSRTTTAGMLLVVLCESQTHEEGLGLLHTMARAGMVAMTDEVELCNHQGKPIGRKTLREALLRRAGRLDGEQSYLPGFYTAQTAQALLGTDPDFFRSQPSNFWDILDGWRGNLERDRHGFETGQRWGKKQVVAPADAWARTVIEDLMPVAMTEQALKGFGNLLAMGLMDAAKALAGNDLDWWLACDNKKTPMIAKASEPALWSHLVETLGVDPWLTMPDGRALWQTLLPKSSGTRAEDGSLRQAVETWVAKESWKEGADPQLVQYLQNNLRRQIFQSTSSAKGGWFNTSLKAREAFLQRLPTNWVEWDLDGQPAWKLGARGIKERDWLAMLGRNQAWREASSLFLRMGMWLATQPHGKLPQVEAVPVNLLAMDRAMLTEKAWQPFESMFASTLGCSAANMGDWLERVRAQAQHHALDCRTPQATSKGRGQRL